MSEDPEQAAAVEAPSLAEEEKGMFFGPPDCDPTIVPCPDGSVPGVNPTTWTVLQQDGPNHLGLRHNAFPGQ